MPASVQRLAMALQVQCPEILVVDNTVCLAMLNAFIKCNPGVGGQEKTMTMMAMCILMVIQEVIQVCTIWCSVKLTDTTPSLLYTSAHP